MIENGEFCLVVGCGSMGRRRIGHLLKLGRTPVRVWDTRADRRREVEDLFNVLAMESQTKTNSLRPRAVFICVPPASHETYIDWAIANNIHFMVEQPISHRTVNLAAIRREVAARGLIAHVSNNHRHSARIRCIKTAIDGSTLGRCLTGVVEIGEWLPDWHPYEPYTDYYPSRKDMGGGLDSVCDVDWLRYLFGEIVEARSLCSRQSDLDIDTHDVVQLLLRFADGPQIALHTDMLQRPYSEQLKLVFTGGTLEHRMPDDFVRQYSVADQAWSEVPLDEDRHVFASMQGKEAFNFVEPMYLEDTRFFLGKLAAGDRDLTSLDQGIRNIETVLELIDAR